MKIIFVTSNRGKVLEASDVFVPLGHTVEQFLDGGELPDFIEPQSDGIEEVTISKMKQALMMVEGAINEETAIIVEAAGLFI